VAQQENPIRDKSFAFALEIVALYRVMREQKEFVLSTQLLRAGTSIGANVEEALAGQTKKDFTAKMCIASKEARETKYWLRLIKESGIVRAKLEKPLDHVDELIRMLTAIVKTSQRGK
jgi:four helix bundle protein